MAAVVQALAKRSLMAAAQAGSAELVAEHVAQGADLAARDGHGRTALMAACAQGHPRIVELLLAAGATLGLPDKRGRTVFDYGLMMQGRVYDKMGRFVVEDGLHRLRKPAYVLATHFHRSARLDSISNIIQNLFDPDANKHEEAVRAVGKLMSNEDLHIKQAIGAGGLEAAQALTNRVIEALLWTTEHDPDYDLKLKACECWTSSKWAFNHSRRL